MTGPFCRVPAKLAPPTSTFDLCPLRFGHLVLCSPLSSPVAALSKVAFANLGYTGADLARQHQIARLSGILRGRVSAHPESAMQERTPAWDSKSSIFAGLSPRNSQTFWKLNRTPGATGCDGTSPRRPALST